MYHHETTKRNDKKILIAYVIICIVGYGALKIFFNINHIEYGHHFNFDNELGINIDSLEISVGNRKAVIHASSNCLETLEGEINVPKKGYPHKVTFKIYSHENSLVLEADSFNCYNCDGYHEYILKHSGAEYQFSP